MCEGLECQNKEFKPYPCTNGIFRLYLQGKHRTDLTRERTRAGRKRWGCHNCMKCNRLGDYSDSNRRKGTTSGNLRHKESITRFRRGFKVTLGIGTRKLGVIQLFTGYLNTHDGQDLC